jgi:hypothetical protein
MKFQPSLRVALLCLFCASAALAQRAELNSANPINQIQQAEPQQTNPCIRGNTRAIISGVDINEMHCQLEMVARRLGLLEYELTQLEAKNALLQSDLDEAKKMQPTPAPTK